MSELYDAIIIISSSFLLLGYLLAVTIAHSA